MPLRPTFTREDVLIHKDVLIHEAVIIWGGLIWRGLIWLAVPAGFEQ